MKRLKAFFHSLSKAYRAALFIGLLFILAALALWPAGLFLKAERTNESVSDPHTDSAPLSEKTVAGSFVGTGRLLEGLGFRLSVSADSFASSELSLTLYGEGGEELYSGRLSGKELKNNTYAVFPVRVFASEGETFSFSLRWEGEGRGPLLQLGSPDSLPWEALYGWYEGENLPFYPLMSFTYSVSPEIADALPFWMSMGLFLILLFGALGVWKSGAAPYLAILFAAFYACSSLYLTDEAGIPIRLTGRELENVRGSHDYDYVGISERADLAGTMARTKEFTLNPGTYRIGVGYLTDTPYNTVSIRDNGSPFTEFSLDPAVRYVEKEIELEKGSQFFLTEFNYSGQGMLIVNSFSLIPEGVFYTDHAYLIILVFFAAAAAIFFIFYWKHRWKRFLSADTPESAASEQKELLKKNRGLPDPGRPASEKSLKSLACGAILLLLAVFAMHPYFIGYLPYGDDVCYHLIRIEGVKDCLAVGQLPALLYPEGVLGRGYLGFLYPALFLYFPAVLRLFGVSTALAWKSLVFAFHLLTAFGTFSCVKLITGSRKGGLFAALLYTLFPYRLACFIARAALGEALAFSFFPFLFAGLWLILYAKKDAVEAAETTPSREAASREEDHAGAKKETAAAPGKAFAFGPRNIAITRRELKPETKGVILLAVGFSGLLHTHVLSCLLGFLICLIFGVLRFGALIREKRFIPVLQAAGLTIVLNLWFILPFIELYLHGGLASDALSWSTYREYSLLPVSLFGTFTSGDYRMYALGVPILAGAALYLIFRGRAGRLRGFLAPCVVLGGMLVFMALSAFPSYALMDALPFWKSLLTTLQFPWRLLGLAGFLFILAGAGALFGPGAADERETADEAAVGGKETAADGRFSDDAAVCSAAPADSASAAVRVGRNEATSAAPAEETPAEDEAGRRAAGGITGESAGSAGRGFCFPQFPQLPRHAADILGISLMFLAVAMVPRYDTSGGDYYAYESYDAEYTTAHYMKLIGIPKTENTIVYPYEWMPEGAGEAQALEAGEPEFLTASADGELSAENSAETTLSSWERNGTTTRLFYEIAETENAEAAGAFENPRYAVLPLFAYPLYRAIDENGAPVELSRTEEGLMKLSLSAVPGSHSITVTYAPPASLMPGMLGTALGLVGLVAYLLYRRRRAALSSR